MHMADALISPLVGGAMYAATAGVAAYSIKKVQTDSEDKIIPLMGVVGAFVFASQMINFTIPGTGSSGHLGGGMLLAILLGPSAGFLTMTSILFIQALFFGDGGLLALGCNVINLGFYSCFIAYPLIYKKIVRRGFTAKKLFWASVISSVVALQMGAFSVVVQTVLSGKTELPFGTFTLLMQPIHLAIGLIEGFVTAAVVTFVWKSRPEILSFHTTHEEKARLSRRSVLAIILVVALLGAGVISLFASTNPDGLEWALEKTTGTAELEANGTIYHKLAHLQSRTAFLPDYDFSEDTSLSALGDYGTTVAGIVGIALTCVMSIALGYFVRLRKSKSAKAV